MTEYTYILYNHYGGSISSTSKERIYLIYEEKPTAYKGLPKKIKIDS